MKSYCQGRIIFPCQTGLGRRGRAVWSAPPGPRRRGHAAGSGLPRQQQGSRSRRSFLWVRNVLCEKNFAVLFSGTDSPSLKMGTVCRKVAEDVVTKDCFVPRTVLSQGRFSTKFLGQKIHRTFGQSTGTILNSVQHMSIHFRQFLLFCYLTGDYHVIMPTLQYFTIETFRFYAFVNKKT
jgi:hypothetical protein